MTVGEGGGGDGEGGGNCFHTRVLVCFELWEEKRVVREKSGVKLVIRKD